MATPEKGSGLFSQLQKAVFNQDPCRMNEIIRQRLEQEQRFRQAEVSQGLLGSLSSAFDVKGQNRPPTVYREYDVKRDAFHAWVDSERKPRQKKPKSLREQLQQETDTWLANALV